MECSHKETVMEVSRVLTTKGFIVKREAWFSTTLGVEFKDEYEDVLEVVLGPYYTCRKSNDDTFSKFKFNVANAFLGANSPWIGMHNPEFQTRIDIIGVYYADLEGLPLYTFFVRKDPKEIALRTILIEVEHRHSLEKAVERIKYYPTNKLIIWTRGETGGFLEGIPVITARNDGFGCYVPELPKILDSLIEKINCYTGRDKKNPTEIEVETEKKEDRDREDDLSETIWKPRKIKRNPRLSDFGIE